MLLRNGKEFSLTDAHLKQLKSEFPGFPKKPVFVRFPQEAYGRVNKETRKPDKPSGRYVPLVGTIVEDGMPSEYRYYESAQKDGDSIRYHPNDFTLIERRPVVNAELLWFLWNVSPYSTDGKNAKGSIRKVFEFENLEKEATKLIERERLEIRAKAFLLDEEIGLKDKEVVQVAKSYFLRTDEASANELRKILYDKLKQEGKIGRKSEQVWGEFIERAKINEVVQVKSEIQEAIDKKLITWNPKKRKWFYLDNGEESAEITSSVINKLNPEEGLYDFLMSREDDYKNFRESIKGKQASK